MTEQEKAVKAINDFIKKTDNIDLEDESVWVAVKSFIDEMRATGKDALDYIKP